jgi:hypothetical protein
MHISAEFHKLLDTCEGDLERALVTCHLEGGTVEDLLKIAVSELKGVMQSED